MTALLVFPCARGRAFRTPKDVCLFENALGDGRQIVHRRCPSR